LLKKAWAAHEQEAAPETCKTYHVSTYLPLLGSDLHVVTYHGVTRLVVGGNVLYLPVG